MFHWIWVLIVGAIVGAIAGEITGRGDRMGCVTNILAGLVGAGVGQALFGHWGWHVAGMAVFPAIIGAVIVVAVVSFFVDRR